MRPRPVCSHLVPASPIYHGPPYGFISFLFTIALAYGIDPVHFGIIFLANLELAYLTPPSGMNLYFSSAMFRKSLREVAISVLPAALAIFLGVLTISLLPFLSTWLPSVAGFGL